MSRLRDELAGIVDLFGALTRAELERALEELAFKQGRDANAEALAEEVDAALAAYYLVEYERDDGTKLLAVGPAAFPELPEDADDLPHIMDIGTREVDRAALGRQTAARLREEAEMAVEAGDEDRIERLIDASYDLEAWSPVEVTEVRARLDEALQD
jgi:hypothetical protein